MLERRKLELSASLTMRGWDAINIMHGRFAEAATLHECTFEQQLRAVRYGGPCL